MRGHEGGRARRRAGAGTSMKDEGMTQGDVDGRRLVFIGGLHRSGTSPLARTLATHPAVSAFRDTGVPEDEGQHLQDVYPTAGDGGGVGVFGFSPAGRLTERSELATPDAAVRLLRSWSPHWDLGREVLVEKSPPNLIRSRFLASIFPGARFIMVVRHPVAVSLASRKWSVAGVDTLLAHWLACHQLLVDDLAGRSDVLVVRYEDIAAAPTASLGTVQAFAGLEPRTLGGEWRSGVNQRYFASWRRQRLLWSRRRRRLVHRLEESVNAFGYSLTDLDWLGAPAAVPPPTRASLSGERTA